MAAVTAGAQQAENLPPAVPASPAGVPIEFLPPPLENATYSLGIYALKDDRLVRQLHMAAPESAFTAGLNGLITKWDGNDASGKPVPAGKYAARGYAVGALEVKGEDILDNDWAADDESLRIKSVLAITFIPADKGLVALASTAGGDNALVRFSGDGKLLWRVPVAGFPADAHPWLKLDAEGIAVFPERPSSQRTGVGSEGVYNVGDGGRIAGVSRGVAVKVMPLRETPGMIPLPAFSPAQIDPTLRNPDLSLSTRATPTESGASHNAALARGGPSGGAPRTIVDEFVASPGKDSTRWTARGLAGLKQIAPDGTILRHLEVTPGDPLPQAVSASSTEDRLYLLEEKPGWQRVRGLLWVEAKEEEGKQVSTWQTFFERNIRAPDLPKTTAIEIKLVQNPLEPGKPQTAKLAAAFDEHGSYLTTVDGLRLRQVSERPFLQQAAVNEPKPGGGLEFFQFDDAAVDKFKIVNTREMMRFDAGEFEVKGGAEKRVEGKAPDPDL